MDESAQSPRPFSPTPEVAELTRAMARGEEAAYRQFYERYFDRLLRYLLVVTGGDEQAARDALSGALVRVARHVRAFDAEEAFWSWLTVLARSALADESKKRGRWLAFLDRFSRHATVEHAAGPPIEAGDKLGELLAQALAALPPDEREVITAKYVLRRSVREIAAAQQTTEKAVESRLSRIRRKLKENILGKL